MKKSIESIWKNGFVNDDKFIVPKLNDLYNQKSNHIIERFMVMFRRNLKGVIIGGLLLFLISYIAEVPLVGGFMLLLLAWIVYLGFKNIHQLGKIDKGESSYEYLKSFDRWMKNALQSYAVIYKFVYPLFFLAFMTGFWYSPVSDILREKILNDPDTVFVLGIPIFWVLPVVLFAFLFSIFSNQIFLFDIKSVYGGLINKLNELIEDMEKLNANS